MTDTNKPRGFAALPVCEAAGGRETAPSFLTEWPVLKLPERKYVGTLLGIFKCFEDPILPPGTVVMRSSVQSIIVTGLEVDGEVKP